MTLFLTRSLWIAKFKVTLTIRSPRRSPSSKTCPDKSSNSYPADTINPTCIELIKFQQLDTELSPNGKRHLFTSICCICWCDSVDSMWVQYIMTSFHCIHGLHMTIRTELGPPTGICVLTINPEDSAVKRFLNS